jgi:4-amino-4-deoxy-L-arabinose transferase-like glycosyltransferase
MSLFSSDLLRRVGTVAAAVLLVVLAFLNLSDYPTTWFDEGSHLHVPQTLVRHGEYADYSSDGFRHFGPTLGVGPTVLLPIAAVYKVFGIGLLQARVVMALYLLLGLYLAYRMGRYMGGPRLAVVALAFLISSPTLGLLETGRQVLGEVPALCFLLGGLLVWFSAWDGRWSRLTLAGVLLGLAAVTKYQNLVMLAPAMLLTLAANEFYYRGAPRRVFLWPGILVAALFAVWQAILVVYLGPQTAGENLVALREATQGAAAAFSPDAMRRAAGYLLSFSTYGGVLLLAIPYGAFCVAPRTRAAQQWSVLLLLVVVNLSWYVVASIGWPRYAFGGLAISSLFVARFFLDLLAQLGGPAAEDADREAQGGKRAVRLRAVVAVWAFLVAAPPFLSVIRPIIRPPENTPAAMAAFLDRELPTTTLIETWEPEMGALTAHNYHYPPARLLAVAVRHIWLGGASPYEQYKALEVDRPPYVLVGEFGRWVDVYRQDVLDRDYTLVTTIGAYQLYRRADVTLADAHR